MTISLCMRFMDQAALSPFPSGGGVRGEGDEVLDAAPHPRLLSRGGET